MTFDLIGSKSFSTKLQYAKIERRRNNHILFFFGYKLKLNMKTTSFRTQIHQWINYILYKRRPVTDCLLDLQKILKKHEVNTVFQI